MTYAITLENIRQTYAELEPLYRQHYSEMVARMAECGVELSPYNPRKDVYFKAGDDGWLLTFVLRYNTETGPKAESQAVGYCNIYVTNYMHNQDKIAQEDTIYVMPEHRHGAGRLLSRKVHEELKDRGVKRLSVTTATDLRVFSWLKRQGYKHTAHHMTITF